MARRADPERNAAGWRLVGVLAAGRRLVGVLALLAVAGCGARGRDYTVRGKVAQLPAPGQPASAFLIAHQAVDRFVDRDGKVTGMDPMTMSFPLADGVSLAGLAVDDPIEFTLHVDWTADSAIRITQLRKLPPGTRIVFRAAQPGQ